jgi:hypothetical protein
MIVPAASEPGTRRGQIIQGAYTVLGEVERIGESVNRRTGDSTPLSPFLCAGSVGGAPKANKKRRRPHAPDPPPNPARRWAAKGMALVGVVVLGAVAIGSAKYMRTGERGKSTLVASAPASIGESSAPRVRVALSVGEREAASENAESEKALSVSLTIAAKTDGAKEPALVESAMLATPHPSPLPQGERENRRPTKAVIKRRRNLSEEDLRKELRLMPEIPNLSLLAMNQLMGAQKQYFEIYKGIIQDPALLLKVRPDLKSLPIRQGRSCQLDQRSAANLEAFSRKLHYLVAQARPEESDGQHAMPALLRKFLQEEARGKGRKWLRAEAVPALQQILMQENQALRWLLVELLAEIPGPAASAALAQRAIFDLSAEVRALAIQTLNDRPRPEFRQVLLNGLRYPWAPVADHAAEALAALRDQEVVPILVSYLKEADPSPTSKGPTLRREVVRINHAVNCLMCHAPAGTLTDPVSSWVPGITLLGTVRVQGRCMLEDIPTESGFLIRADITYLRQDFSIREPLKTPGTDLVLHPRFDFLVRTRKVKAEEAKTLKTKAAKPQQREAVLFALRELTGTDAGSETNAWAKLYPPAKLDDEARRLKSNW